MKQLSIITWTKLRRYIPNFLLGLSLYLVLNACNLAVIPDVGPSYKMSIVSGNNQLNALAGSDLASFEVIVRGVSDNQPVQGVSVKFDVTEGDGQFFNSKSIVVVTNSSGKAVAKLTLGTKCHQKNSIVAQITGSSTQVVFTAQANKFKDVRDGQIYPTIMLSDGTVWMAKNLNYDATNSWCYDNSSTQCGAFGRLYTMNEAVSACPNGWKLPIGSLWKNLLSTYGTNAYSNLIEGGSSDLNLKKGGLRIHTNGGVFQKLNASGYYWSWGGGSSVDALVIGSSTIAIQPQNVDYGMSCRCIQTP